MKKLVTLYALTALLLVTPVFGCRQQPQQEATPTLTVMVESSIIEAGSSFTVSGSNFKPGQKVWVDIEWRASDRTEGVQVYCEADDEGLIYPIIIEVPEDTIPGDYEVEIYIGENVYDRQLLTTLPIHIQAVK